MHQNSNQIGANNMIKILDYTKLPLTLMGEVASVCWDSKPSRRIAESCLKSGHDRVSEFADVTLEIADYSSRTIRELYNHVSGVSRLQKSTRYVNEGEFAYYTPDSIHDKPEALAQYDRIMHEISNCYKILENQGIPKQDIANILPLGSHTKIVLKINIRALIHMSNLRLCHRALKEYRDLMNEILQEVRTINDEYEYIMKHYCVPKCVKDGFCREDHCCGLMPKVFEL
jgi:thymidylate synthase (FAD)